MSTEELQVAVMTARAETDREIERIEEMEKETCSVTRSTVRIRETSLCAKG